MSDAPDSCDSDRVGCEDSGEPDRDDEPSWVVLDRRDDPSHSDRDRRDDGDENRPDPGHIS